MLKLPRESIVSRHIAVTWDHGVQAEATLIAAAYITCQWLLPIEASESDVYHYIVAMERAIPALLEISVCLPIGQCELSLRVPPDMERVGQALLDRIHETAMQLAPGGELGTKRIPVGMKEELPF